MIIKQRNINSKDPLFSALMAHEINGIELNEINLGAIIKHHSTMKL